MQAWVGGETNACFARSKSMNLNDFLIYRNTLTIWLSRNLITQSHGDRFRECINKWQLFLILLTFDLNFVPKKHYNQKIKIATIWSLEIRHWCKNNQLSSFITEKWLNLNDLNSQNSLACFNRIILHCYFVVRTVRIKAINRLVSKKIVQWIDLEWLQNIDQNLTSR